MNVETLHKELTRLIAEGKGALEVVTEGCDCDGDVGGVEVREDCVYLCRSQY